MGNIVLLDELTINKIAAGEVIERPASVVKELVENSIDAGATNINIEVKNGGISYIRITDNGKGIMQDDMEIAFERHATSKIRTADDLESVKSMGFRGEALASIAAIAKVEMISKTRESDIGYKIIVEGGNIIDKHEEGCQSGTIITVENLFYNTPVRYKFLKKDFTEAGYIEDVVTRIALINPNIAIKLVSGGKTVIQTSGNGDMKTVVYNIYGKDVAENILDVNYMYEDIKISGVVGKPSIARSNRANQLFFVNKRYIRDKVLASGAEQAFKGMITVGKFGFLILNVELNPKKVDINVHPAKLEVRFEDENKIFKAIYHAIKDTLLKGDLVAETQEKEDLPKENIIYTNKDEQNEKIGLFQRFRNKAEEPKEEKENFVEEIFNSRNTARIPVISDETLKKSDKLLQEESEKYGNLIKNLNTDVNQAMNNTEMNEEISNAQNTDKLEKTQVIDINKLKEEIDNKQEKSVTSYPLTYQEIKENMNSKNEYNNNFESMYESIFGKPLVKNEEKQNEEEKMNLQTVTEIDNVSVFEGKEEFNKPVYKFIGIAFSTYIIIEMDNEMYIIDQHAAHERILYEKVKENYYSNGPKDSQLMLLPDVITLTNKEMDIAKDNMEMFKKAGFELEEFGENTIKLTGVPNICIDLNTKDLFLETLDEINTVARTAKQEIEEKFIATVACKAAVKANMALTEQEVNSLMDKLLKLPNPFTCPHGRPTAIKMTKTDIEKKFSRK